MATVICRRLRGGVHRATTFSSTAKWARKTILNEHGNGYTLHPIKQDSSKETDIKAVNSLDYLVLYNPAAYHGHKKCREAYEDNSLEHDYATSNAKQIHNTYSITCSRSLSSTKNNILDLAFSRHDPVQPKQVFKRKSEKRSQEIAKIDDDEAYNTKETQRAFQKRRPDYKSLCFNNADRFEETTVEEGYDILQKVTVLKSSLTPATISEYFEKCSRLPTEHIENTQSNPRFAMLCRYGVENIQLYTQTELIRILHAFVCLEIPPSHSMLNVYEQEFCRRVWNMSIDELLFAADLWRYLGRSVPKFLEILYSYMQLRWNDLSLIQLIQLIYIIGEGRRAPPELMQKLESLVFIHLESMNMEEIGVVCLGFFKSSNGLSEHLMRKIGDRVSKNMDDINNFALVNVLKMFRYTHVDHLRFLKQLGQTVPQRIPTMGIQGIMHIALSCAALHYLDENIMNAIAATVPEKVLYCRSKDLAKILWSFGVLNYRPPNSESFYTAVAEEIRKKLQEFEKYPEHFLTCLLGLVFAQQFPLDLIEFALSDKFVSLATKDSLFELKKDLFTLDGTVEIECAEYTGSHISFKLRQEVTEMLMNFARQDICIKPEVLEAATLLESMFGGPHFVKNHMILPHTRSMDLEVHLDINEKPIPINKETAFTQVAKSELKPVGVHITDDLLCQILDQKRTNNLCNEPVLSIKKDYCTEPKEVISRKTQNCLTPPPNPDFFDGVTITDYLISTLTRSKIVDDKPVRQSKNNLDIIKLAIQVSHKNHYCYASKHLLGLHSLKRRQLRHLGYVVVELPFWEWIPLLKRTKSEKLAYLHQKIFGTLRYHR
ncbi:FAST kinase domain-containing protein 5, mitochondrial [Bombina bombina]|uniref:FAST kinase domain-containing protein 5, mitochondrial n=1 Tax=Bombina bombina TaxID=8345 RepID=UPI00235B13A8|nr:FAST kinase domain-containing protein 5, mitochondrial [Bombina bombina]XP_053560283.1 FAST kinase domain-containing protein 5, mitochondrial [Bombina bombina]XP_053560285.1 FAST kinase domain-containing protein 5, mitochondrial [Bombina bombina]